MIFFKKRKVVFFAIVSVLLLFIIFLIVNGRGASVFLLSISDKYYRPGVNNIGDIVGIFDDKHQFTQAEKEGFIIIKVNGIGKKQLEDSLQKLLPDTAGWTEEQLGTNLTQPKYRFRVADVSKTRLNILAIKLEKFFVTNVEVKSVIEEK